MREIKFRAWSILSRRMLTNNDLWDIPYNELFIHTPDQRALNMMQYTGLKDKNGTEIYEGDIVETITEDGEPRRLVVSIETVERVLMHPDFQGSHSKVAITGVVFRWNGYELFPTIHDGKADNEFMTVVGNIYENEDDSSGSYNEGCQI